MLKKIIKDSSIYSINSILTSVVSVLLIPLYTRVFAPTDYGVIDILNIASTLVYLTIALEISQAVGRFTADGKNDSGKSVYFSTALIFVFFAYSLFVIIAIPNTEYLSQFILDSNEKSDIVKVAILSIWATGIFNLLKDQLRWLSRPTHYSIVCTSSSLISILITVFLVLVMKTGVIGVFCGIFIGNLTCLFLAFYYLKSYFMFVVDRKKLIEMLNFSIPLVPSSICFFIFIYIDRLIIKQLMTFNDLGLYGVGYKMASMLGLLIGGTQMALTPFIYNNYSEKNTPLKLAKLSRYFTCLAFTIILGMSLFAKEILMIFTTPIYYKAAEIVPFLVLAIFFSGIYVFAPGLWILKKTKFIALIDILAACINIALNYALIPLWGIKGAAIATLVSSFTMFCINQIISQKYYPIQYPWKKATYCLFIVLLIILLNNILLDFSLFINILLKLLFMFVGASSIIFILIGKSEFLIFKKEAEKAVSRLTLSTIKKIISRG